MVCLVLHLLYHMCLAQHIAVKTGTVEIYIAHKLQAQCCAACILQDAVYWRPEVAASLSLACGHTMVYSVSCVYTAHNCNACNQRFTYTVTTHCQHRGASATQATATEL
jgi:hypothetical protein